MMLCTISNGYSNIEDYKYKLWKKIVDIYSYRLIFLPHSIGFVTYKVLDVLSPEFSIRNYFLGNFATLKSKEKIFFYCFQ